MKTYSIILLSFLIAILNACSFSNITTKFKDKLESHKLKKHSPKKSRNHIDIVTWNVENFPNKGSKYGADIEMDTLRIKLLAEAINKTAADIYAFQEFRSQKALDLLVEKLGKDKWDGTGYFNTHQGRCFLVKKSKAKMINSKALRLKKDTLNRYSSPRHPLEISVILNKSDTINLINVHLKAFMEEDCIEKRKCSLRKLKNYMDDYKGSKFILLGDFNNEINKYDVFKEFLSDSTNYEFADSKIENKKPICSYPKFSSHIDHIIVNKPLMHRVDTTFTISYDLDDKNYRKYISDHRPVYMRIRRNK